MSPIHVTDVSFGPVQVKSGHGYIPCEFSCTINGVKFTGIHDPKMTRNKTLDGDIDSIVNLVQDGVEVSYSFEGSRRITGIFGTLTPI